MNRYSTVIFELKGDPACVPEALAAARMAATMYPGARLVVCVGGYDDDPREVYEIREAYETVAEFALGIDEADLLECFDQTSQALMELCLAALKGKRIWRDPDNPDRIGIEG